MLLLMSCTMGSRTVVLYDASRSTRPDVDELRAAAISVRDGVQALSGEHEVGLVVFAGDALVVQGFEEAGGDAWEALDYCVDDVWDHHEAEHGLDCCAPTDCSQWPPDAWWTTGTNVVPGLELATDLLVAADDGRKFDEHVVVLMSGDPACWSPGLLPSCEKERRADTREVADELGDRGVHVHDLRDSAEAKPVLQRNRGVRCVGDFEGCAGDVLAVVE
jgi:hypothetical protein